jgi:uncharacterized membrane protein
MAHVSTPFRFATVTADGVQWRLKRNCSVTPRQLLAVYLWLCLVSLGIASFFWSVGATLVLPFAVVETIALGIALLVYARHAADAECVSVRQGHLVVEMETAGRRERVEFRPPWVRVAPVLGRQALIEVSGQGRTVAIGRYVRPECRIEVAEEIRQALGSGRVPHGV